MAYPFPHQEQHKVYPNTFLENTSVSLIACHWDGVFSSDFEKLYPKFVDSFFHLPKSVEDFKKQKEMSVSAPEDGLTYSFKPDKAYIRRDRKSYISFLSSIMTEILPLKVFLFDVMKFSSIENLQVRKLNILPIEAESDDEIRNKLMDVYRFLYSDDFLKYVQDATLPIDAPWILNFRKAVFSEGDNEVTLRIGIAKANNKEHIYNVVLDSSARCSKPSIIEEGSVDRKLLKLNDCLYDAFHWCVKEDIIQLMEEEK